MAVARLGLLHGWTLQGSSWWLTIVAVRCLRVRLNRFAVVAVVSAWPWRPPPPHFLDEGIQILPLSRAMKTCQCCLVIFQRSLDFWRSEWICDTHSYPVHRILKDAGWIIKREGTGRLAVNVVDNWEFEINLKRSCRRWIERDSSQPVDLPNYLLPYKYFTVTLFKCLGIHLAKIVVKIYT